MLAFLSRDDCPNSEPSVQNFTSQTFLASRLRFPRSERHDPKLGSLHNSFCPSVSIEFFENRGDVKFDGVEGNAQSTRDCFVGGTICHRREHFKFAGRQVIARAELITQKVAQY